MNQPLIVGLANGVRQAAIEKLVRDADWSPLVREVLAKEGIESNALYSAVMETLDFEKYDMDVSLYVYAKDRWEEGPDAFAPTFR